MIFSTIYKGHEYRTDAADFEAAQSDLEEQIGRPLPNGSEIRNESTGETHTMRWNLQEEEESPAEFVRRVNNTSAEQLDAFEEVLQCDLFGVNV